MFHIEESGNVEGGKRILCDDGIKFETYSHHDARVGEAKVDAAGTRLPPLNEHCLAAGPVHSCNDKTFFSDATGTPALL